MPRSQTFLFEELNEATQDYLREVRDNKGRLMPGIFVPKGNALPWAGLILGIVGIVVVLIATLPPWDNPISTAFAQMAVILPCGWMIVAAFRVWVAKGSPTYLGHFVYADTHYLWEVNGSSVEVTELFDLNEATSTVNYNEGNYQNTAMVIRFKSGTRNLTVNDEERSRQLTVYLNALAWMYTEEAGELKDLPGHIKGALCREIAKQGEMPPSITKNDVAVESIPEPTKGGLARSNFLSYIIIAILAVAGIYLMKEINIGLRDDAIYEAVRTPPVKVSNLRAYLIDDRNTAHRADIEKLLVSMYQNPVQLLKNGQNVDPELNGVFCEIVQSLAKAKQPIVSLRIKDTSADEVKKQFFSNVQGDRIKAIQNKIADQISKRVGLELILFAEAPDDLPALMDISFSITPNENQPGVGMLSTTIALRTKPDEEPKVKKTLTKIAITDPGAFQTVWSQIITVLVGLEAVNM